MVAPTDSYVKKPNFLVTLIQKPPKKLLRPMVAILFVLTVWQVICSAPGAPLPSPSKVVSDTWELIVNPFFVREGTDVGIFWQIFASLQRVAVGYSLAAIVGISAGILLGCNPFLYDAFDPLFQVLRTIPPLAWLPISLAVFQAFNPLEKAGVKVNEVAAIFVIFVTAVWPIVMNTTVGVQQIPQDYKNVAKVLQLPARKYFFKILFPASVPYIFSGLRIGIGLSWLAIVAAEMLVGGVGIGFFIWDNYNSSRTSHIILGLLYVGIVGLLLDRLIAFIARLVVPEEQKE
ncbi:nitrate ABC transporter permease [Oscillatoria sp. FACHB-1406]|uniref:nitrate ABC transporter permease n=1 Tax=Oscillatoria sp. FACHB-1406 TaxID=2692846 RepID=UPI0016838902|nr:nitrate ABC transporter permease [Oscillatoria sp. FACHB-1406]MBD2577337.1 nitrate ABC transporter permease [Oscillatoria sp. FACHB-1406]